MSTTTPSSASAAANPVTARRPHRWRAGQGAPARVRPALTRPDARLRRSRRSCAHQSCLMTATDSPTYNLPCLGLAVSPAPAAGRRPSSSGCGPRAYPAVASGKPVRSPASTATDRTRRPEAASAITASHASEQGFQPGVRAGADYLGGDTPLPVDHQRARDRLRLHGAVERQHDLAARVGQAGVADPEAPLERLRGRPVVPLVHADEP